MGNGKIFIDLMIEKHSTLLDKKPKTKQKQQVQTEKNNDSVNDNSD